MTDQPNDEDAARADAFGATLARAATMLGRESVALAEERAQSVVSGVFSGISLGQAYEKHYNASISRNGANAIVNADQYVFSDWDSSASSDIFYRITTLI